MAKNRIIYGIILISIVAFIGLYEHRVTYIALYAVLLIPVLSLLYMIVSVVTAKNRFDIQEMLSSRTVKKGEKVQYFLTVKNNSFFNYSKIEAVFQKNKRNKSNQRITIDPKTQMFSLLPREDREIIYDITGNQRGIFNIGISRLCIYDSLGLFRMSKKFIGNLELTVLPNPLYLPELPLLSESYKDNSDRVGHREEDYTVISELRKYIPSDGYKKIHWKLSAKRNEFISKNYQNSSSKSVILAIDNSRFPKNINSSDAVSCEDGLIEALISVIAYCAGKQFYVSLNFIGKGIDTIGVPSKQLESLYAAASNIAFDGQERFDDFFFRVMSTRQDTSNILIFMRELTDLFCDSVKTLKFFGNHVVIFCFAAERTKEMQKRTEDLRSAGVICYFLSGKINIAEVLKIS